MRRLIWISVASVLGIGCVDAKSGSDRRTLDAGPEDARTSTDSAIDGMPDTGSDPIVTPPVDAGQDGRSPDAKPGAPEDATVDAGTCEDGAVRCAGLGGAARERCINGKFVATDPCEDDHVCDSQSAEATCLPLAEVCVGHADAFVCVGAELHACSPDAIDVGTSTCESERHCQQGLDLGQCATCLPGTASCEGRQLQQCAEDGSAWEDLELCETEDLCNPEAGACTDSACLPGGKVCQDNDLMVCNASQTAFVLDEACGAGLCDPSARECDACIPDTRSCSTGQRYQVCSADGQGYNESACPQGTPYCVGAGTCVECTSSGQCSVSNPCQQATCNAGSCGAQNRPTGTGSCNPATASSGVCDGSGGCIECVDAGDCSTSYCISNMCRTCNGPCGVGESCNRDSDCASGDCASSVCRPECSGDCGIGDVCAVNADCDSGECDSSSKRCTQTCGTVTILTTSSYNDARNCVSIEGNLEIPVSAVPTELEFPYLTEITGNIENAGNFTQLSGLMSLRMPKLRTIGGSAIISLTSLSAVSWPELRSIGTTLSVTQMDAEEIVLPELETVGGTIAVVGAPAVVSVDMRALRNAGDVQLIQLASLSATNFSSIQTVGSVDLNSLLQLSYHMVEPLVNHATGSTSVAGVGCCLVGPNQTNAGCGEDFDFSSYCN